MPADVLILQQINVQDVLNRKAIPFLESGWSALAISVPGVILKLQLVHLMICR